MEVKGIMTLYNLTAIGNFNNTLQFTQNVNTYLMDGWFGILMLGTIGIIMFMAFTYSTKNPIKSFVAASFISFIMAVMLYAVSLVPIMAIWVTLIGTGIGVAFWNLGE